MQSEATFVTYEVIPRPEVAEVQGIVTFALGHSLSRSATTCPKPVALRKTSLSYREIATNTARSCHAPLSARVRRFSCWIEFTDYKEGHLWQS